MNIIGWGTAEPQATWLVMPKICSAKTLIQGKVNAANGTPSDLFTKPLSQATREAILDHFMY